jgi:hypothetical protein
MFFFLRLFQSSVWIFDFLRFFRVRHFSFFYFNVLLFEFSSMENLFWLLFFQIFHFHLISFVERNLHDSLKMNLLCLFEYAQIIILVISRIFFFFFFFFFFGIRFKVRYCFKFELINNYSLDFLSQRFSTFLGHSFITFFTYFEVPLLKY